MKVIGQLKSREEIHDSHRKIKVARKKPFVGGIRKLTKIDKSGTGEVVEVTEKHEMVELLMQANGQKFRGSQGTPLTEEPLKSALGWTSTTKQAEQILVGDFSWIHTSVSSAVRKIFKKARLSKEVRESPAIAAEIRPCDFIATWKKQDERTQPSLLGLHFGFFKSILADPVLTNTMAHLSSIPFETGYAPERWRKSLNVHLMKKQGEYSPSKQRTIHLLEASFSAPTKTIFSQRLMKQTRKLNLIPEEQFA